MVYINPAACAGCGKCVDTCPSGAIQLMGSVAQIDRDLCRGCEACAPACPHQAILVAQESQPVKKSVIVRPPAAVPEPAISGPGLWPAISAALAFIGQEIVPRAAWALLDAWDQRQSRRDIISSSRQDVTHAGYNPRGGGHRWRWRGGQSCWR